MWNEHATETLREKWNEGITAERIAQYLEAEIGKPVTKNMVVGKARRLKLPFRHPATRMLYGRDLQGRKLRRRRHSVANPHYSFGKGHDNYCPTDPTPEVTYDETPTVPFLDREDGQCGWPIGDPQDRWPKFGCCGAHSVPGQRYCTKHAARSVGRVLPARGYNARVQRENDYNVVLRSPEKDAEPDVYELMTGVGAA